MTRQPIIDSTFVRTLTSVAIAAMKRDELRTSYKSAFGKSCPRGKGHNAAAIRVLLRSALGEQLNEDAQNDDAVVMNSRVKTPKTPKNEVILSGLINGGAGTTIDGGAITFTLDQLEAAGVCPAGRKFGAYWRASNSGGKAAQALGFNSSLRKVGGERVLIVTSYSLWNPLLESDLIKVNPA